ncbi:MAG: hypothetical protein OXC31_09490 [Spirochaetaceae bacterium]|nr:hypothetical protein [Spirochaetaceae bacterium]
MHSSFLRGSDFRITLQREEVPHDRFFRDLSATDRVGVFAPGGLDGLGAGLLLLAHTTAFYDRYRESGSEFFAYPDYFTFQRRTPTASYSMFDVWPGHKDVTVPEDAGRTLDAILDRAITVLVVPAGPPGSAGFAPVQVASARRTIRRCYAYSVTGSAEHPTLAVACTRDEPAEWARTVIESLPDDGTAVRSHWQRVVDGGSIPEQSFTEMPMEQALALIR